MVTLQWMDLTKCLRNPSIHLIQILTGELDNGPLRIVLARMHLTVYCQFLGYVGGNHTLSYNYSLKCFIQVVEKLGLSFHNVRTLHGKIDAMPDRAGTWQTKALTFRDLPGEEFTIWHRDPMEAIKGLWKDANLSPHMTFAPSKVYVDSTKSDRVYSEMWTSQWWHVLQVCVFNAANNLLMLTKLSEPCE